MDSERMAVDQIAHMGRRIAEHWSEGRRDVVRQLLLARDGWARCALAAACCDIVRAKQSSGDALRFVAWLGMGCPAGEVVTIQPEELRQSAQL